MNNETISPRKMAANRANAQKSTGPRTAAGKAASRLNARKHGILSKEVLVRALNRYENERELVRLHEWFRDDLQPVGPVEELLVDQIVTAQWRLRRVFQAEAGEIATNMDEAHWQRNREVPSALMWSSWDRLGDSAEEMQYSARGSQLMESWLKELRETVEKDGELTEAAIKEFTRGFGSRGNGVTRELEWLAAQLANNPDNLNEADLRERNKARVLRWLDRKIGRFFVSKNLCESYEGWMEESRKAATVLPSASTLTKISRYEAGLQQQLYRAMTQLERLQRLRREAEMRNEPKLK